MVTLKSEDGASRAMITSNPADAANLKDRGRLRAGLRADITLVKAVPGRTVHAVTSIVGGCVAYAGFESPMCQP